LGYAVSAGGDCLYRFQPKAGGHPSTLQRGIALSCNKLREIRSWGADVIIREFDELVKFVS